MLRHRTLYTQYPTVDYSREQQQQQQQNRLPALCTYSVSYNLIVSLH